ncbi:MAG: serine/threonine-protein kinase, partial [Bdellovibrionia bacterium]
MSEVLKKFGRYFLLDHIAQGGMAEIYRARLASIDGAGRIIVIKRIQGGFGANKEFLQMFKSEIKVTMGFNHPNIVQLYDFGEEMEQPFIAMEWIDGRNLRQLMSRFAELKQSFPVELVTYIIEQAASGLNYAHSFRDKISGTPLNVVHRDISPQNIITSFEGTVKVIDFGIAKATTNVESTRAGVIKGKPSYLSPEQISGDVLDGRSDIFALGAVLWEMLTGKKLFAGESDLAVLKLIESCHTHVKPPSTLNPSVPKELDYIVLKTLARQKEKRYQSAEELQKALHKFLFSFNPEFNPSDLSYHARDLFKNEIVEDRKLIQKLNNKAEKLLLLGEAEIAALDPEPKSKRDDHRNKEDSTIADFKSSGGRAIELDADHKSTQIEFEAAPTNAPATQRSRASTSMASPLPRSAVNNHPSNPQRTNTQKSSPSRPRQTARTSERSGFPKLLTIAIVALLGVSFVGPQFGVSVPVLSDLLTDSSGGIEARLTLEGNDKNVTVAINGTKMAKSLPATLKGLAVGTPLQITVSGQNGFFQEEITLRKGEQKSVTVSLNGVSTTPAAASARSVANTANEKVAEKMIQLRLNISPGVTQANITLNGAQVDSSYPVVQAPLDTPLSLQIDSPGYKVFKKEFTLESRQLNGLREWPMEIALEAGHYGILTI